MKRTTLIVAGSLFILIIYALSNTNFGADISPTQFVENFLKARMVGDFDTFYEYSSKSGKESLQKQGISKEEYIKRSRLWYEHSINLIEAYIGKLEVPQGYTLDNANKVLVPVIEVCKCKGKMAEQAKKYSKRLISIYYHYFIFEKELGKDWIWTSEYSAFKDGDTKDVDKILGKNRNKIDTPVIQLKKSDDKIVIKNIDSLPTIASLYKAFGY